jgi:peptidoglycan-associated lipoprotein
MMRKFGACLLFFLLSVVFATAQQAPRMEVALGYNYAHANAPPAGCGCFSMNGGSGSVAWNAKPWLGVVGEVGVLRASDIDPAGHDLTLTSVLFGPRFSYHRKQSSGEAPRAHPLVPFIQALFGVAHASGALSGTLSGSSTGFAFATGGGLDLGLNRRFTWRLIQTEYLLTRAPNQANDHQNNFRFTSGIVIKLGGS